MTMYTITGTLHHVFPQPIVDRETGEKREQAKIQIIGDLPVKDSDQVRLDLVTLSVQSLADYKPLVGKKIRIPFGMFSPGKGQIVQFVPKGSKPETVTDAESNHARTSS